MLSEGPAVMLDEWSAYFSLEPFGQVRGDLQAGQICTSLHHLFAAQAGVTSEVEIDDFVMTFGEESKSDEEVLDPDEAWAIMVTWANANNARIAAEQGVKP